MKTKVFTITCCLIIFLFAFEALAVEVKLLDSKVYTRTKGKPNVYTDVFPGEVGTGSIVVLNGKRDGSYRVSSAKIYVNNQLVFREKHFKKKVFKLQKGIQLKESNTIEVKLNGAPKTYLTISVYQDINSGGGGVIGPDGGVVEVLDETSDVFGTRIYFEPNSLDKDTVISISGGLQEFQDSDQKFLYIQLEPSGLILNVPAKIEIPYDSTSVPDKDLLFVYIYSPAVPLKYGVSENSRWEQVKILSATDTTIEAELKHFSWLVPYTHKPIYTVLHLEGKYLKEADLIFALARIEGDPSDMYDWLPGHAALYLGTREATNDPSINDGETIIESVPDKVVFGNFTDFRDIGVNYHIHMGARKYRGILTSEDREKIAHYAISKNGYDYSLVGQGNPGDNSDAFSCVGLVEAAYDNAGKSIIPEDKELPFILPLYQFVRTIPISDIAVKVGADIEIPVRGVLLENVVTPEKEIGKYRAIGATAINLREDIGMSFVDNIFSWQPQEPGIFHVNFRSSGVYSGNGYSAIQLLIITVDDYNHPLPYEIEGNTVTKNGGGTWGSVLELRGIIVGTKLILAVTKGDYTPWQTSGTVYFKVGSYEPWGVDRGYGYTEANVTTFVAHEHDLSQYPGPYPKEFYVRYVPDDSDEEKEFAWVGPIKVVKNSN